MIVKNALVLPGVLGFLAISILMVDFVFLPEQPKPALLPQPVALRELPPDYWIERDMSTGQARYRYCYPYGSNGAAACGSSRDSMDKAIALAIDMYTVEYGLIAERWEKVKP